MYLFFSLIYFFKDKRLIGKLKIPEVICNIEQLKKCNTHTFYKVVAASFKFSFQNWLLDRFLTNKTTVTKAN